MKSSSSTSSFRGGLLQAGASIKLFDAATYVTRRQLRVLTYHSVVDVQPEVTKKYPFTYRNAISAERFDKQMSFLAKRFNVIDATTFRNYLNGALIDNPAVLITLDDGLINNRTVAAPILTHHNLPALFFVPTGFVDAASCDQPRFHWTEDLSAQIESYFYAHDVGLASLKDALPASWPTPSDGPSTYLTCLLDYLKKRPYHNRRAQIKAFRDSLGHSYDPALFPADRQGHSVLETMTWNDVRELAHQSFDIGSHTVNHRILSRIDKDAAKHEVTESKQVLERELNRTCHLFSYPNGTSADFSRAHQEMLATTGYAAAFTQIPGFANQRTPRMQVNRIDVSQNHPLPTFRYLLSGLKHTLVNPIARRS